MERQNNKADEFQAAKLFSGYFPTLLAFVPRPTSDALLEGVRTKWDSTDKRICKVQE